MAAKLPVVLYHYDASPYAAKTRNILLLKQIAHERVEVSSVLPRPELSQLLGVTYRRIPILAIGNDVYCDTSIIASALERRFPPSQGYASLFPPRKGGGKADAAFMKLFSVFYVGALFPLAGATLPWDKFPAAFLEDRSAWFGQTIDLKAKEAEFPEKKSLLSSHLRSLEQQLSDGREWLMDTEAPSLVDISTYMVYNWIRFFKTVRDLFDEKSVPNTLLWLGRMSTLLSDLEKRNPSLFRNISGEDAAKLISSSSYEDYDVVGFDAEEAGRLGLTQGQLVSITPSDTGRVPTVGKLVAFGHEEAVIEVQNSTKDTVRCHFPRINYTILSVTEGDAKL